MVAKKKPSKKTPKKEEHKTIEPIVIDEPTGLMDDDFNSSYDQPEDNPFKELENLISGKGIDLKTVLNERQVIHMHKLDMLSSLLSEEGDAESAKLVDRFTNRFFTLVINKDGLSRSQFIEAIKNGREKAEEAKREKQAAAMGNII